MDWRDYEIDERLIKAIGKHGWAKPTSVQKKALPYVLSGKNVIVKAFTGSGKTAIFLLPLLQKILTFKDLKSECVFGIILVPSKDLSNQTYENIKKLTLYCKDVSYVQLPSSKSLAIKNHIVISTPANILGPLKNNSINLSNLKFIIIDEADLLISFGYEEDLRELMKYLPRNTQTILTSATINKDVKFLQNLFHNEPVLIKLQNSPHLPPQTQLTQYIIKCEEDEDKFTLTYIILKLRLLLGKTIFFVNNIERCYKLKLYLEIFGIKCCLLNSELPLISRCHIMSQFNQGLYDYIIAADESIKQLNATSKANKLDKKHTKDNEFRASRGLDFQRISNVVNFDFPKTIKAYIHRVGRTARANNNGTALSFVLPQDVLILNKIENYLNPKDTTSHAMEPLIKTFNIPLKQLEGFKYRSLDAFRSITRILIKEARLKEIKNEILKSEKLKTFFAQNPHDLVVLRHDSSISTKNALVKNQASMHMRHVPDYLIPPSLKDIVPNINAISTTSASKLPKRKKPKMNDPLKSFKRQ